MDRHLRKSRITNLSRLGGELPLFVDRLGPPNDWSANWLGFSHSRAALTWLIEKQKPQSALVCAYTCPSVPAFLRRRRLKPSFFDVGASSDEIVAVSRRLPAPQLVLLPALFGSPPWQSPELANALSDSAIVVIDAAQTAFGHRDFAPPPGGAIFSSPRKSTALADGAVLSLGRGMAVGRGVASLPVAQEAAAWKYAARALWATRRQELEMQALEFNRKGEEALSDEPRRMSDESRLLLERMDTDWHRKMRRSNRRILVQALGGRFPIWAPDSGTPFSLPAFVREPAKLISKLKEQRIFATRLWPDAEHDPDRHPAAAYMVRHLVGLPVDQRHSEADMGRVAEATLRAADPPPAPPMALQNMIRQ